MNGAEVPGGIGALIAGVSAVGYIVAALVSLVVSASIAVLVAVLLAACFPARSTSPTPARRTAGDRRALRAGPLPALGAAGSLIAAVLLVIGVFAALDGAKTTVPVGTASQIEPPPGSSATTTTPPTEATRPAPSRPVARAPGTTASVPGDSAPYMPDPNAALQMATGATTTTPPPSMAVPRPSTTVRPAPPTTRRAPTTTAPRELRLPIL